MAAPGKRRSNSWTIALSTLFLITIGQVLEAKAANLLDDDMYDYLDRRYTLLLKEDRSSCGYYADPTEIRSRRNLRYLNLRVIRGPSGGTACFGMIAFPLLKVDCQTQMLTYAYPSKPPEYWRIDRHKDTAVAQKVCALPARPLQP